MAKYAAALDQGTTSTRCMIFDHGGKVVAVAQKEHEQIYPKPGWVEHDANEIWDRTREVIDEALDSAGASADDIAGVGITDQRETTLVWDKTTGEPVHNAIVWQDTRTDRLVDEFARDGGQDRFREKVGLPLATYFSGPKIRWILDNVDGVADKAEAGDLGDQQAATFGQTCFSVGEAKNTYGTGNFLLLNTGTEAVQSKSGLITTVGYKIGDQDTVYCLEGSIAITGALVQWLRDNLKMIRTAPEVEDLAKTVEDNGGCYIVPAFSGLFAPYWKGNARGVFSGLTRYVNNGHIARATLEATAFQSREVSDAMNAESGVELESLKVDGGMVVNETLMQFQADILGVPVIRPQVAETTALGAAYAAGLATGFWNTEDELRENWVEDKRWEPKMDESAREKAFHFWKKAVERTFDWAE